ncbi:hypothetical protein A5678_14360 [Mycobacterium sp. E2733]|nr:hypothetical protein A5678_14360 [Mycobacterium sp. E2733]
MASPGTGGAFRWLGDSVVRWPLVIIGAWMLLAAALFLIFPPLEQIVREHQAPMVPANSPAMVTAQQMTKAFHESGSDNVLLAVLTNENGLGPGDEAVYRTLVATLRQDTQDVVMLQDFLATPELREAMSSKDHHAWLLPIGLAGGLGTPQSHEAYTRVADVIKQTAAGSTLTANLAGPAATIADRDEAATRDMHRIELATAIMVLAILLIIYRNPFTMMLPLVMIAVSLVTAHGIVAGLSQLGLGVSDETIIFMTVIMAGAGTDYAVFLISRYHEHLRRGADSDHAIMRALVSIGKVIAASAATVAVTFFGMSFTRLKFLSTIGPALAISIAVAFLAAITFLPAILVLAGRRSWVTPRRDLTSRFWRRSGIRIVRRPTAHLLISVIVLAVLAGCGCFVRFNWDESKTLPGSVESSRGYAVLGRHFPLNETIPQYLLIQSPHDLRTPKALADLEQMARRVSQIPNIAKIRGITRPTGEPLEQARLSYQAGEVGDRLRAASDLITGKTLDLDRLTDGARELANYLASIRGEVNQAASSINGVVGAFSDSRIQIARSQLQRLAHDGTLDRIATAAREVLPAQDAKSLESAVYGLRGEIEGAASNLSSLGLDPGAVSARLATLQHGADALADGSRRVADGVQLLVDQVKQMGAGLSDASTFLLAMKRDASGPAMAGFYIPMQALSDNEFKKAAEVFVSPDGHAVRYLIQTQLNPFSTDAMDQVNSITDTSRGAQLNTTLADASISMTGYPASNRDLRDYYNHDLRFMVITTVLVVLLILIVLLRALVAPLHLIGSVVISYLSALGVGVIAFQFILGQQLSWSVPGMAFIVLVAVGADYNMLLISRVRDESPHGVRSGVIRTVGSTGGVITSAGVIFAASMFGLLFGTLTGMVQVGFIIGVGLLLDTFVVRTITVPAMAVLCGRGNWWPTLWGRRLNWPIMRTQRMRTAERK